MISTKKSYTFVLFALSVLLAWGLSWPIMKLSLLNIPPIWMGAFRMIIGSVCLFSLLLIRGDKIYLTKNDLSFIASVGIGQMCLMIALVNVGLSYVEAGRSAILLYTTPLWVTPIAVIFFHEPLRKLTLMGLLTGLIGVLLLFNPLNFDWTNKLVLLGNGLLLLASVIWSLTIIHIRFGKHHRSALELAPWQMLTAAISLAILGWIFEPYPTIHWSGRFLAEMFYIGVIATAFGFWGVIEMNRQLPAIKTTLILLAVPIIGLISSAIFLHEKLTLNLIISMILILLGLLCVSLDKNIEPKLSDSAIE